MRNILNMSSTSSAGNIFMFLPFIYTSSDVLVNSCVILKDDPLSLLNKTIILGERDRNYADIYNCRVILMFL